MKIIVDDEDKEYHQTFIKVGLETLADKREIISQIFEKKSISNVKLEKHFMKDNKSHSMETRNAEIF